MGRRDETRQRMLDSALALLRERGANGVTLDAVLAHSGAPRGSIYHHFPGGRDRLIVEAAALGGDLVTDIVESAADPRSALTGLVTFWKQLLCESDFRAGCPIVALAVDGPDRIPEAACLARDTFERVAAALIARLRESGATDAQATSSANVAVAALEGAVILCRVQRSTRPLDDVAAHLASQLG
ncbi:MAG: TetR/AcrR family transcriptional regulator [Mycobacterium sp.]